VEKSSEGVPGAARLRGAEVLDRRLQRGDGGLGPALAQIGLTEPHLRRGREGSTGSERLDGSVDGGLQQRRAVVGRSELVRSAALPHERADVTAGGSVEGDLGPLRGVERVVVAVQGEQGLGA
jgi:hypothetical protein